MMVNRLSFLTACLVALGSTAFAQDAAVEADVSAGGSAEVTADVAADADLGEDPDAGMAALRPETEPEPMDTSIVAVSDAQADSEDAAPVDEVRSGTDPYEESGQAYMFLGAAYRHTWTPGFMLGLFLDEYEATDNPGFGLEFTYRKDSFDIVTSVMYQGYRVHGAFRGSGDADTETEIIDSDLAAIFVGVDLMWSTEFKPWFALEYGIGLGLGVVFGSMTRNEARPNPNGEFNGYDQCAGPDASTGAYCDAPPAGHYGSFDKWFQGGSVPNLYLRAALPHIALRFKPIHQMIIRIDGGFDVFSGFFAGGALAYGF